jgi:hypothetical protein
MVICQNCKSLNLWGDAEVVYFSGEYSIYLCFDCTDTREQYLWEQAPAVRVCDECSGKNEFFPWCFTCINEKIFWSRLKRNQVQS